MARILVIDDDVQVRDMLHEMLARVRHDVVAAADGAEGLEAMRAGPVDLVVTDLLMPNMDGLAAIREMKRAFPHVPVIALTGGTARDGSDPLARALSIGAVATLRKPVDWEELTLAVSRALGHAEGRRKQA